jgi:Rrf2 family transcriptional regulator, iron-sulfur cluster assembly transcription factor
LTYLLGLLSPEQTGKDDQMKLGTKGRYAVMAMVDLAKMGDAGPVTLADISERQDISLSYLEQLFAKLRRAGVVTSYRGPGGGYRLARSTAHTKIADIILAVDEPIETTRCIQGAEIGCMGTKGRCATHDLWEELRTHIVRFLDVVTLEDVLAGRVLGLSAVMDAAEPDFTDPHEAVALA